MKQRNAPANKGKQLVSFTHQDAQRINAAVASHENARRARNASSLPRAAGGGGVVQVASFTGGWFKSSSKVVLMSEGITAVAFNPLFNVVSYTNATSRSCIVSGGLLVSVDCNIP